MNILKENTFKMAISATIAIFIAESFGLKFGVTSGIIAILSIQNTKKEALLVGGKRLLAATIAVLLSYFLYMLLGNTAIIFGLFLLIYITITKELNIEEGMVVGAVLSTHLLVSSNINLSWILNEEYLTLIGIGVASLFNLYMPSLEEKFKEKRESIEIAYREIINDMAQSLVLRAVPINEMEKLRRVEKDIEEARDIAYKINNNFLFKDELYYIDYIEMRIKQLDSIKRMKSHFSRFYMNYEQTLIMADFTKDVAMNIYDGNDCIELLYKLKKLRFSYRDMELPKTRDEFENRAMLFQFLNDLEDFLTLKKDFRKMYKN
ncbi:MAG: aromatic acid exporter family protein [Clostridium baratii]|uniref:aromatic acid exporter family protein n=1 Tax=Clostridium baratii TaxID=1561 RepID=UPI002432AD0A|nr:aromatic acid exporter family protein [Clostridium baratii]MBS6005637.1 aromatic acid exporter family protein [Clostridium baratii]